MMQNNMNNITKKLMDNKEQSGILNKFKKWMQCQWAIFQYVDSVEATNGNSLQWEVDKKIKQIKKYYE